MGKYHWYMEKLFYHWTLAFKDHLLLDIKHTKDEKVKDAALKVMELLEKDLSEYKLSHETSCPVCSKTKIENV